MIIMRTYVIGAAAVLAAVLVFAAGTEMNSILKSSGHGRDVASAAADDGSPLGLAGHLEKAVVVEEPEEGIARKLRHDLGAGRPDGGSHR